MGTANSNYCSHCCATEQQLIVTGLSPLYTLQKIVVLIYLNTKTLHILHYLNY